ncbi:MAG: sensor histidine kinase N-terminal domain-containing protein [Chloroflexia bacterium]
MRGRVGSAPLSLRARLTAWHGLVLALTLVAFAASLYALLARGLTTEMDRTLDARALQVSRAITGRGPRQDRPRAPLADRTIVLPRPAGLASADTFVQVAGLDGQVLASSENLQGATLPLEGRDLTSASLGSASYRVVDLNGEPLRLFTGPVIVGSTPVGVVQVARSYGAISGPLAQLRLLFGAGLLLAIGLSGLVVVSAGAALRPLDELTRTALAVGVSGDLHRRVITNAADDEVGPRRDV